MEVSSQAHAPAALVSGKEQPLHIRYEADWAPGPVWELWRREESLALVGNPTPSTRLSSSQCNLQTD
jgi:hypothetical protein